MCRDLGLVLGSQGSGMKDRGLIIQFRVWGSMSGFSPTVATIRDLWAS